MKEDVQEFCIITEYSWIPENFYKVSEINCVGSLAITARGARAAIVKGKIVYDVIW